jgi:hypothetical protein
MNDEHREGNSSSGWSSGTVGGSTATAEPVDRRWFEEALRAQGFLVEPPAVDEEPRWRDAAGLAAAPQADGRDDAPLPVEVDDGRTTNTAVEPESQPADDLALAEAEAVLETAPLVAEAEAQAEAAAAASGLEPQAEPWDLPRPSSLGNAEPIAIEHVTWPVIGAAPSLLTTAAVAGPAAQPIVPSTRQAVPPATLPPDVAPVPTAALAARLSRRTAAAAPVIEAPAEPSAPEIEAVTPDIEAPTEPSAPGIDAVAPPVEDAPVAMPASTDAAERWTLPALQADLAAERAGGAAAVSDTGSQRTPADLPEPVIASAPAVDAPETTTGVTIAVGPTTSEAAGSVVIDAAIADSMVESRPEATLDPATELQPAVAQTESTAAPERVAVAPGHPAAGQPAAAQPDPAAAQAGPTAVPVSVQPAAPFSPPTAGIAAIARRPTVQTVGPTVDDGESDLWGLVGDPAKPSAIATAAPVAGSSSRTTALLTVFVAIVVVALVLGFIYLFTSLL